MSNIFYDLADEIYTITSPSVPDILRQAVLTVWDITQQQKRSEWSLKGAMFTGVEAENGSKAGSKRRGVIRIVPLRLDGTRTLHEICSVETDLRPVNIPLCDDVSKTVMYNRKTEEHAHLDDVGDNQHHHCLQTLFRSQRIILLHSGDAGSLHKIHFIKTNLRPVNITGDIIILSDDASKTLIYHCKTDKRAYLDNVGIQHDRCCQVVFTPLTILVVRAGRPPSPASPHIPLA
ncbi:uncharacterized protein ARMOST_20919 [Armillaria ostoyae]|uniref:Uncharacterized protein n=1 Tax=Armillaria ostoyae TaxID=47428 RepID=A0A284S8M9_ARMOS|nr:uncharacterized protein ARMOST_20919 [Armillaria ostoyae]